MTTATRDRRALKVLGLGLIVVVAGYLFFFAEEVEVMQT